MSCTTVLVTGGAGFIGMHLVKELSKQYTVYVLDNFSSSSDHPVNQEWFAKNPSLIQIKVDDVYYIKGDTCDIMDLCKHIDPKYVFHFGEFSRINLSWQYTDIVYKTNLYGSTRVFDYCVQKKSVLMYSASSAIFGDSTDRNKLDLECISPYTWTKAKMVELVKLYHKWYALDYTVFYFYNVYGPGQISQGDYATVLGIFEQQYLQGKPLTVVNPGTQTRCFTHIDDIISGIMLVLHSKESKELQTATGLCPLETDRDAKHPSEAQSADKSPTGGAWSVEDLRHIPVSSTDVYSILQIANMFAIHDIHSTIEFLPARAGDRTSSVKCLPDVLRTKFKWKSTKNLNDWIATRVKTDFIADTD